MGLALLLSALAWADASAPSATLSGRTLDLELMGLHYELVGAVVLSGRSAELRWDQPVDEGDNRLRFALGTSRPETAPVQPEPALVEIQPGKDQGTTRNVTRFCSASGTVRLDGKLRAGGTASGAADLVLTCRGVAELPEPLVVRGTFSGLPVR